MSFFCDYDNNIPQMLLKIDKNLITDPDNVAIYINLPHIDSIEALTQSVVTYPEIENPCGEGTITGQAYLQQIVLVAGVRYSILLYDSITMNKVYDGEADSVTAYSVLGVQPLGTEVDIDPRLVTPEFDTVLTRVPDVEGVDYYLYTVEGTVNLLYSGVIN